MSDIVYLIGGVVLKIHDLKQCSGRCPFHSPTEHHMRSWPQTYREDRGITERVCDHGIGHPDPDDYKIYKKIDVGVHGCDGCCSEEET